MYTNTFTGAVHKTDKELSNAVKAVGADSHMRKVRDKISFGAAITDPIKQAIVKATSLEIVPPKEKHVQKLIYQVSDGRSLESIVDELMKRTGHADSAVVLKTVIVIHRLIRDARPEIKVSKALLPHLSGFNKAKFHDDKSPDAWEMTVMVRTYCQYMEEKLHTTRQLKVEYEQDRNRKKLSKVEDEELFNILPLLQTQLNAALAVEVRDQTSNQTVISGFAVLFKDTINLYRAVNEGVMKLLENYFEQPVDVAQKILDIYRAFDSQTKSLCEFFNKAKALLSKDVGSTELKGAPESFLKALEEYIASGGQTVKEEELPTPVPIELDLDDSVNLFGDSPVKATGGASAAQAASFFGEDDFSSPAVAPNMGAGGGAAAKAEPALSTAAAKPAVDLLGDDIDPVSQALMNQHLSAPIAATGSAAAEAAKPKFGVQAQPLIPQSQQMGGMQSNMGMQGGMGGMQNNMGMQGGMGGMQSNMGMQGGMGGMQSNMGMQGGMGGMQSNMGMQGGMGGMQSNMGMQGGMGMQSNMGMQGGMGMQSNMGMQGMQGGYGMANSMGGGMMPTSPNSMGGGYGGMMPTSPNTMHGGMGMGGGMATSPSASPYMSPSQGMTSPNAGRTTHTGAPMSMSGGVARGGTNASHVPAPAAAPKQQDAFGALFDMAKSPASSPGPKR